MIVYCGEGKEFVGEVLTLKGFDMNFLYVRRLLQNKGRCSDERTIHKKFLKQLNLSVREVKECSSLIELKEKYPEEFV